MNDARHWNARQSQGSWEITDGVVRFAVPDSFGAAFGSFDQGADLTEALRLLRQEYESYIENSQKDPLPYQFYCSACGGSGPTKLECEHVETEGPYRCPAANLRDFLAAHPETPS